jgi:hypothetical protein
MKGEKRAGEEGGKAGGGDGMRVPNFGDGDMNDRGHVWVRPAFDEAIACFAGGGQAGGQHCKCRASQGSQP